MYEIVSGTLTELPEFVVELLKSNCAVWVAAVLVNDWVAVRASRDAFDGDGDGVGDGVGAGTGAGVLAVPPPPHDASISASASAGAVAFTRC